MDSEERITEVSTHWYGPQPQKESTTQYGRQYWNIHGTKHFSGVDFGNIDLTDIGTYL